MPHSLESTSAANDPDEAYTRFDKARFDQCLLELQNILNRELRGSSKTDSRISKEHKNADCSSDENCYHFVAAPKRQPSEAAAQRSRSFMTPPQVASPKTGGARSKSVKKCNDSIYNNAFDDHHHDP